jgi:hypothetical protein
MSLLKTANREPASNFELQTPFLARFASSFLIYTFVAKKNLDYLVK